MRDKELIAIANEAAEILKDIDLGLDDIILIIKVMASRIEELTEENLR